MQKLLDSFSHRKEEPEESVLYIVSSPIGNLNDISKRALNILSKASLIACEDTRNTGKLLKFFNISNKLISYHKHNFKERIPYLISQLKLKKSIALISDAGTPLISDPGETLVQKTRESNFEVISIPGPCAAISALVSSGLPTSKFTFYGFIPRIKKERDIILNSIETSQFTSIVYESPKKLKKLLEDLKQVCGGNRRIKALKEISKLHEKNYGDNIDDLILHFSKIEPKGEFTLIIEGNNKVKEKKITNIKDELINLTDAGLSHSAASIYLSKKLSIPKNEIYKLLINKNQ